MHHFQLFQTRNFSKVGAIQISVGGIGVTGLGEMMNWCNDEMV